MKLYDQYFGKLPPRPAVTKSVTKKVALPKVGRPRKANGLTPAQKQAAYRARKKTNG